MPALAAAPGFVLAQLSEAREVPTGEAASLPTQSFPLPLINGNQELVNHNATRHARPRPVGVMRAAYTPVTIVTGGARCLIQIKVRGRGRSRFEKMMRCGHTGFVQDGNLRRLQMH